MRRVLFVLLIATVMGGLLTASPAGAADPVPGPEMGPDDAPQEIIGGTPADPGEFPYQVALVFSDAPGIPVRGQFCGGSLISPDTVLTAAHCVVWDIDRHGRPITIPPEEIDVIAGTTDLGIGGGGERLGVRRIDVSPDFEFDWRAWFNWLVPDVAILELSSDSAQTPIALATPEQVDLVAGGTPAVVSGWGLTANDHSANPVNLHSADVSMISDDDCATAYGSDFDAVLNVCAGDLMNGGVDACYGDSGGPLVVDDGGTPVQVGVVLGGDGCGFPQRPGIYTRISTNIDFLARYQDPDEVPDRPRNLVTAQSEHHVRVSWRPPAFDGGTAITGYEVKVGNRPVVTRGPYARHVDIDISALRTGRPYRVTVRAVNEVGTGAPRIRTYTPTPIALP